MKITKEQILLIDDNTELASLMSDTLSDEFHLDYAPDGFTAQKMIMRNAYSIILCDINMPFLNGLMLIEEFKKKNITIPFIFISGVIDNEITKQAFQLGASNVVQKPFNLKDLKAKIRLAISFYQESVSKDKSEQERGYIYNQLKAFYYDFEKIIYNIQFYNIPLNLVSEELEKKERTGKCLLDDPEYVKLMTTINQATGSDH